MTEIAAFSVLPLGTGNFFSAQRYCSSLLLMTASSRVLIDCPEPFYRMCADAARTSGLDVDPATFDHIIITHIHGDHCNGLEGFGFFRKFVSTRKVRPTIHTTPAVAEVLWSKLSPAMGESIESDGTKTHFELSDYFDLHVFGFGESFEIDDIRFETRRTQHSVPSIAFRATHAGRCFGYSCDTSFDPGLITFLGSADLIFHETDYGDMHTPLKKLEQLPPDLRAKLHLIHLGDEFTASKHIEAAQEGKLYEV